MNDVEFRGRLEQDLSWREAEIRILGNQHAFAASEAERRALRRVQVVMLYAHFEGFCKIAFSSYLQAINARGHVRSEVNDALAAASLMQQFTELEAPTKLNLFRHLLPNDQDLHKLGRQVAFVKSIQGFWAAVLDVPTEPFTETGNLEPIVLKKFLYRLGLDPHMFVAHDGVLFRLVKLRHLIAHGETNGAVDDDGFKEMYEAVKNAFTEIMSELTKSLREESYRRR